MRRASSSGKVTMGNADSHDVKFEQESVEKKKMLATEQDCHHVAVKYRVQRCPFCVTSTKPA